MKQITLLTLGLFLSLCTFAKVFTVNNNTTLPNNPGQYMTIQAAADTASSGDTILIAGSLTSYNTTNINKKLVIIGPGFDPQKTNFLTAICAFTIFNGGSFSVFMGINGSFSFGGSGSAGDILFKRNILTGITFTSNSYRCIIEQNVIISGGISINNALNIQIRNNYITGSAIVNSNSPTLQIKNNLFTCGSTFGNIIYADIRNNIFYASNPGNILTNISKSAYSKNLTFSNTYDSIPYTDNVGAGNLINQNPQFVNINTTNSCLNGNVANLLVPFDFRLGPTSPARNAGTDGTDIGPSGGSSPIYQSTTGPLIIVPPTPEIYFMNILASSIPTGGSINVQVKAKKRN